MDNLTKIEKKIYTIRDKQVMLDSDLAQLYQVETRVFNQAVKRNIKRFPQSFRFQLSEDEYQSLTSQFVTSSLSFPKPKHGGRRHLPFVFTKQGVSMLSAILRSDIAIEVSIQIIEAFVSMRKFLTNNASLFQKIDTIFKAIENKPITIKEFKNSHDRFMIIDKTEVYHIGASLKDLGQKWFAFSKMDIKSVKILERLGEK